MSYDISTAGDTTKFSKKQFLYLNNIIIKTAADVHRIKVNKIATYGQYVVYCITT